MRNPLQESSGTPYQRPNQPWLCGQAGGPCPMGPDQSGVCTAATACHPVRDGDRWQCNRSELRGGECEEGPSPEGECCQVYRCKPFRSLRSRRARFAMVCMLATLGGLCLMLSADWRNQAIAPGQLSVHHAQLVQGGSETKRCANCHVAGDQTLGQWLGHVWDEGLAQPRQTELCLECHRKQIAPERARLAHNVSIEMLLARGGEDRSGAAAENRRRDPREPLACAACHREHHGLQHNLAGMSDVACQACHRQQFDSLADGHPEFAQWPWRRRTRIAFDHAAHQAKHHSKEKKEFRCADCHMADASGAFQLTLDYESACASCHDETIKASLASGVALLSLPMLDVEVLQAAGHDMGEWPEAATDDFDGALPPIMQMLLIADPQAATAIARLGSDFDFFDLDTDDEASLEAAAQLAQGIQRLLHEVQEQSQDAVRQRVEQLLGRSLSTAELAALGGWHHDAPTLAIRYRPTGHVDPWMTAWLDVATEASTGPHAALVEPLLRRWMAPTATGLCGSCHSLDQDADGRRQIQWTALTPFAPKELSQHLTRFSHQPHLLQPSLTDCTACHELDPEAEVMASYPGDNPHVFVSGFLPLRKQDCAACHTSQAAGNSCLQCHRYHVHP